MNSARPLNANPAPSAAGKSLTFRFGTPRPRSGRRSGWSSRHRTRCVLDARRFAATSDGVLESCCGGSVRGRHGATGTRATRHQDCSQSTSQRDTGPTASPKTAVSEIRANRRALVVDSSPTSGLLGVASFFGPGTSVPGRARSPALTRTRCVIVEWLTCSAGLPRRPMRAVGRVLQLEARWQCRSRRSRAPRAPDVFDRSPTQCCPAGGAPYG